MMNKTYLEPEQPERKKKLKLKRVIIISISVLLLMTMLVCVGISIYVGHSMTHPDKKPIDQFPSDYGMEFEDITFESRDGETNLSGWVLNPEEQAKMTVVFGHGYKGNRFEDHVSFFSMAEDLLEKDYRVILFDFRYAGDSGGAMSTVGAKEQLDMLGAIDWATDHYEEPVGLLGISMGASTALLAASQSDDVVGVVADSPFSDLEDYLKVNLPVWSDLPNFPFTPLIMNIMPIMTDLDPKEASPISVLDDIAPRPVLFIHNKGDDSIPYHESEQMVKKHPDVFTLWLTDGKGHVKSYEQNKQIYIEKVDDFFEDLVD